MRRDNGIKLAIGAMLALGAASVYRGGRRGSGALRDEGMVGRYWGRQGVGLLLTTGEKVLLMLRSPYVLDPMVWGVPGGAVRIDDESGELEDIYQAASNELLEEAGISLNPEQIKIAQIGQTVFRDNAFQYTTIIVRVPAEIEDETIFPNWQSNAAEWLTREDVENLREDNMLHFGVMFTLDNAIGIFDE